jgi:peptidoglycan/xylan/chitin deacetylase (PgdA/CDA1 family)
VRWQDHVAHASAAWTRVEFERGMNAFKRVFGFFPTSHAAAGWQINAHALELEREYGLHYASDTRGRTPFWPLLEQGRSTCPQLPTTLPTFDELLGRDGIDESNLADAVLRRAETAGLPRGNPLHVFTLHAELEGMRLLDSFESLLTQWQAAGAQITRMARIREMALQTPMPEQAVTFGEVPGRSGLLAIQPASAATDESNRAA